MKLFNTLSAVALVKAQFNDFANLNQLFESLQANLGEPQVVGGQDSEQAAADGARYIQRTTTSTAAPVTTASTTLAPTGNGCWKCDAMSFAQCAGEGSFETCASDPDTTTGSEAVCFLELRETNQQLQQLCTGCKSANACETLKRQNFIGSAGSYRGGRFADQCKSEWFIQEVGRRYGSQQSTCRTCFLMCDSSNREGCFGGMSNPTQQPHQFKYPTFGNTNDGELNSGTIRLGRAPTQAAIDAVQTTQTVNSKTVYNMGIPTGVLSIQTTAGSDEITDPTTQFPNQLMWGAEGTDGHGKSSTGRGAGNSAANMYLYWAIQDAPQAFWEMDLIDVARIMRESTLSTTYGLTTSTTTDFDGPHILY